MECEKQGKTNVANMDSKEVERRKAKEKILMSKFAQNLENMKHICAKSFSQRSKEERQREKASSPS